MIWHCLTTAPMQERAAQAWLEARGVEAWFPVEERWRPNPRARDPARRRVVISLPVVPRYLFAGFPEPPRWHTLRDCRFLSGVIIVAGKPAVITEAALMQMQQIPSILAARRAEEAARRTIRPGDRATIADGPLAGWSVSVETVHAGVARVILGTTEASIEVARLHKALAVA